MRTACAAIRASESSGDPNRNPSVNCTRRYLIGITEKTWWPRTESNCRHLDFLASLLGLTGTSPPLAAGYYDDGNPEDDTGNTYLARSLEFNVDSITVQDNFYRQSQSSPYWGNFLVRPVAGPDADADGITDTLDNCSEACSE